MYMASQTNPEPVISFCLPERTRLHGYRDNYETDSPAIGFER